MLKMDEALHIRKLYNEEGMNIAEIARETGRDWKTVQKYIDMTDFNVPSMSEQRELCPKLDAYKSKIDEWLNQDKGKKRKERHTARRVYDRLVEEAEGFDCSYRTVSLYVAAKKKELHLRRPEGFIPLVHKPGEAQGDFGEVDFVEAGVQRTGKYFVLDFPYSNAGFAQLHYGENLECLLESLVSIFGHIGGVPTEIWFDNASAIVTQVLRGGGRNLTERFVRFQEHYGFQSVFMNPKAGHEKGAVENKVGYIRRNYLVPTQEFGSLAEFNQKLLQVCDGDMDREHYLHPGESIAERFRRDRLSLRSLPGTAFDTAKYQQVRVDNWGKFTLNDGKHTYSAAPEYAGETVWLKITAEHVQVLDARQNEITTHLRLYGDEQQESMNWLPYLKSIARRPRSLRNSGIYTLLPENMQTYLDSCGNTERGKILKMLCDLTEANGFNGAMDIVNHAILYQAKDPDSLQTLARRLYADVPELPPLENLPAVPPVTQFPADLKGYDSLLGRTVSV